MRDVAIRVEGLKKRYRIGEMQPYKALRDSISRVLLNPLRTVASMVRSTPVYRSAGSERHIWALDDVSFEVRPGEVVGVIGRNGAGKSTLLKVLSRITEPTEGQGEVYGRVGSLLEVGTGFHPELTGRENTFLNGAILGMKKVEIRRKFDEIVSFAEVEKFIDTPVKYYSSGMYVRLAFAVAAYLEPEVLLVDEVLAVGDYDFQKKCLGRIGKVSSEGRTVLLVSHNMPSVSLLCGRSLLMEDGKVAMDGDTRSVVQRYLTSVVERGAQVIWDDAASAPGGERARLQAVQLLAADGEIRNEFDINEDIIIRVAYWNLRDGADPYTGIWLKDELGIVVLQSFNVPHENMGVDEWFGRPHPIGLFETSCRIPGNFLNSDKTYHIDVRNVPRMKTGVNFYVQDVLSFSVSDLGTRNLYAPSSWPGVVRPKLMWESKYMEPTSCAAASRNRI